MNKTAIKPSPNLNALLTHLRSELTIPESHKQKLIALGMYDASSVVKEHEMAQRYHRINDSEINQCFLSFIIKELHGRFFVPEKPTSKDTIEVNATINSFGWIEQVTLRWKETPLEKYRAVPPESILDLAMQHQSNFDYLVVADFEFEHKVIEKTDPLLLGYKNGIRYYIPGGQWLRNVLE